MHEKVLLYISKKRKRKRGIGHHFLNEVASKQADLSLLACLCHGEKLRFIRSS
jgi:hypothetical protein